MNPLTSLPTLIFTHELIHDFLPLRLFTNYIQNHLLDFISILAMEGSSFLLGNFILKILILSSFGLMWILFWYVLVSNEYSQKINISWNWHKFFKTNGHGLIQKTHLSKNKLYKMLLLLVLAFLSVFFYFIIFRNYSMDIKHHLVFLVLNFQVIPGMYIFLENKQELIFITYLVTISMFGIFMIHNVKSNPDKATSLNKNKIQSVIGFNYKSNSLEISKDTKMIFSCKNICF